MTEKRKTFGFTLIELLVALFILSIIGVLSYRGLKTVIEYRKTIQSNVEKWRALTSFTNRFERDIRQSIPRASRIDSAHTSSWVGKVDANNNSIVEFSRSESYEESYSLKRIGYRLNNEQSIELLVWPAVDFSNETIPKNYVLLKNVKVFEVFYTDKTTQKNWIKTFPGNSRQTELPKGVKLHILLNTGEDIVRVYEL